MELPQLKEIILKNTIPNILIFNGVECTLKQIYIDEIAKRLNLKKVYCELEQALLQKNNSLIFEPRLIILTNPKIDEKQIEIISKIKHIIINVDNIDKRSKLYKEFSKNTVDFNLLDTNTLMSILQSKYELDDSQLDWLINACGNDYGKCLQELDKLKIFRLDINIKENQKEMFNHLKSLGVFHQEISDKTYQFVDALSYKNKSETWKLYKDVVAMGHSGVELLALIYSRFRMLLSVQMINSPTPDAIGLTFYQINIIKKFINYYKDTELLSVLSSIKEIDTKIKLGEIEEDMGVPYLLSIIM